MAEFVLFRFFFFFLLLLPCRSGTKEMQTDSETIRGRIQHYADEFTATGETMKKSLEGTLDHVRLATKNKKKQKKT